MASGKSGPAAPGKTAPGPFPERPLSPLPLLDVQPPLTPAEKARLAGSAPSSPAGNSPAAPASTGQAAYPLGVHGPVVGVPYQGSHTMYGNWESDNAVDIAVAYGTPVYAIEAGKIGSQIGSLHSGDPHLQGLRLHLETQGNEFYYAHLSKIIVHAGDTVKAGQLLGYSGRANGLEHLHLASRNGDPRDYLSGHIPDRPPPAHDPNTGAPATTTTAPASPGAPTGPVAPTAPVAGPTAASMPLPMPSPPSITPGGYATPGGYPRTPGETPQAVYFNGPAHLAETWQTIASQPLASPDSQAFAGLAAQ